MSKRDQKSSRPIGFVLPALVFGIGIVAIYSGSPKIVKVWKLTKSGAPVKARILEIEHTKAGTNFKLAYMVGGLDYTTVARLDGDKPIKPPDVLYLPNDPDVATADLPGERKQALGFGIAGLLDLAVGGWILRLAIRQRRARLARSLKK